MEKKYMIIDIETIPDEDISVDLKPKFDPDSIKLGNIKDEEKRQAKIEAERRAFENGLTKKMSVNFMCCGRIL